jgi:hypothetical protein
MTEGTAGPEIRNGESAPSPSARGTQGAAAERVPSRLDKLRQFLVRHPRLVLSGWTLVILAFVLLLPIAYFCWYVLPGELWTFAQQKWWHWVPAFFGYLFLFAIPIWAAIGALSLAGFVADLSLAIEDEAVQDAQQAVRETEEDAIRRLEQTDAAGLLPLLKYSRAQLDAYYAVGLNQTRRSFFNAVLAMWLGFILLLVGIALYVGPVDRIGITRPGQDFQIVILSGAVIIELVSALFLWVYRSTTAQLTYYYRRQMHSHTAILCFRIASTMERPDETKRAIIDKMLDWDDLPERPPVTGAKGIRSLLPSGGSRTTS